METLTKEAVAEAMDGAEYGSEATRFDEKALSRAGLVLVYGASDDLTEFSGAISHETGLGTITIIPKGSKYLALGDGEHDCNCEMCGFKALMNSGRTIETDYGSKGFTVTTSIPHARFTVMEDGDKYGDGIVFSVADLGKYVVATDLQMRARPV